MWAESRHWSLRRAHSSRHARRASLGPCWVLQASSAPATIIPYLTSRPVARRDNWYVGSSKASSWAQPVEQQHALVRQAPSTPPGLRVRFCRRMETEISRFEVPLSWGWSYKSLLSWNGLVGLALGSGVAWGARSLGLDPSGALVVWCAAVAGTLHLLKPSYLALGVDGVLVAWPLGRTLFPWSSVASVEVGASTGNFRRRQAFSLRVADGRTIRIPTSLSRLSMERVERFINARLAVTRPRLPKMLARLETSRDAAATLLENPAGRVYRDDALPPSEWWQLFEATWAKPHERVAAALALGADAYAENRERIETILASFASRPLSRITRRAFASEHADEAHRLLKEASALGASRQWPWRKH